MLTTPHARSVAREGWRGLLGRLSARSPARQSAWRPHPAPPRPAPDDGATPDAPARRDERLHAEAHAAWRSVVEGTPEAALDAALAVVEDELASLRGRAALQAEALKTLRVYAAGPWERRLAGYALDARIATLEAALPGFLIEPALPDCDCEEHSHG
jgi:hypothetical protein